MAVHTQDNAKLVTLANLALYNHTLINNLGLKQDNGAYEYAESSITGDAKATNVKGALDHLYDLVTTARTSAFASTNVSCDDPDDAFIKFSDGQGNEIPNTQLEFVSLDNNFVFGEEEDQSKLDFDIKSIGYGVTKEAETVDEEDKYGYTGDTDGDPLTQKTYVDHEIERAIKNGTVKVETGKATGDVNGTAEFTQVKNGEGQATSNDYYVHLTAGDKVYDILLNADDFVKDAFLNQVEIVKGSKEEDGTFTPNEAGDAYFMFVWNVDNGSEGEEEATKTTYVKTSDILGDLTAGNGIAINDGATISIKLDTASDDKSVVLSTSEDGLKTTVTANEITSGTTGGKTTWSVSEDGSVIADAKTTVAAINDLQGQIDDLDAKSIEGKDAINVAAKKDDATTQVIELTLADSYLSQSEDGLAVETGEVEYEPSTASTVSEKFSGEDNELATTQEVAKVANELQGEIDSLNAASLVNGTAINDNMATGHTLTKQTVKNGEENAGATYYELKLATASDQDITGLFAACGSTDEPGESNS